ncbi:MarR family transcriptional regulator [Sphingomonas sp. BIUV-7]|uniref:MarR family transcriptional regulator n=1 Tax=Sphingomonas natans TaxID=3063330 RepID=A0ABT8Y8N0_9SPHN|nr:MarR family transcriptional regulator [Sphingomonas sp. BIUV-7]MDO6414670.1 MarR family transcriptional regulator [Sphingomonas sp. BIUV-7]
MDAITISESDEARIVRAVLRLARRLRRSSASAALTGSGLALLAGLHRDGPMSAAALASGEGLQPQSLSRLLARLERDGLIDRPVDPLDRRRQVIAITRAGRAALNDAMALRRRWLSTAVAGHLAGAERATLLAAAEIMLRIAAAPQEDAHATG